MDAGVTKWRVWLPQGTRTVIAGSPEDAAKIAQFETGFRPSRVEELDVIEHVCRCGHKDHHEVTRPGVIEKVTTCETCRHETAHEVVL